MRDLRAALFCAGTNFRKWHKNPTILLLAALWATYLLHVVIDVPLLCIENGYYVTPWVLPFVFSWSPATLVYGCALTILFAQAPFCDVSSPFVMVRTGKRAWFWGQILYILGAAFIFVLFTCGCVYLYFAPCMAWDPDWGGVLRGLSEDGSLMKGSVFSVSALILRTYTPLQATIYAFLLLWLSATLIGMLMLFCNVVIRNGIGTIIISTLACWSFFARSAYFWLGSWVCRTMLLQWNSLYAMSPIITRGVEPSEAIIVQLVLIVVCIVTSTAVFCRRDTLFVKNQF
ncbi:MAG: hypothetical protein IJY28_02430 [Clostridia bacterium]|nr:hypothetical protein [Clostridia bacterium]